MGCNCKDDKTKINKLKNFMKKNVNYKLKKSYEHLDFIIFSKQKIAVKNMSQQMMSVLYKNNTDFVEIVESKPTNTYEQKKKSKK